MAFDRDEIFNDEAGAGAIGATTDPAAAADAAVASLIALMKRQLGKTAAPSALANFRFLGVSGNATLTGCFMDENDVQVGKVFSLTIPQGNGTNNPVGFADATYVDGSGAVSIPAEAVGVEGVLSADVYRSKCGNKATELADFKARYASYPREVSLAPMANAFGRIG